MIYVDYTSCTYILNCRFILQKNQAHYLNFSMNFGVNICCIIEKKIYINF